MRPQVVAHRGASHDNAEHTLGAYLAAIETGADGLLPVTLLPADFYDHDERARGDARHAGTRG